MDRWKLFSATAPGHKAEALFPGATGKLRDFVHGETGESGYAGSPVSPDSPVFLYRGGQLKKVMSE